MANLQTTMAGFSNTKGGKAGLAIAALDQNAKAWMKNDMKGRLNEMTGGLLGGDTGKFGSGFFKSTGATAAYQVPRGSVRASSEFYARLRIKDDNTNRLRMGGRRVEGIPMDEKGAVVGGYSSLREFRAAGKRAYYGRVTQARQFMQYFGDGIQSSRVFGTNSLRGEYDRLVSATASIQSTLSSAGLGYKTTNARWTRGAGPAHFAYVKSEWAKVKSYNANQLNKAQEINTLQQGFGLTGFSGSTMSLPSLQDEVAKQDELIKTIGLNRTEAFQIIDTQGRGRDEIDARVLWKNRVNNISTGTSVL